MKVRGIPFLGLVALAGLHPWSVCGQDLHYADMAQEEMPRLRIQGFPEVPDTLKTYPGYGYTYVQRLVDPKGNLVQWNWATTNKWLETYMLEHTDDIGARKPAKGSSGYDWLEVACIFNPKQAGKSGSTVAARLESVFLPKVSEVMSEPMPPTVEAVIDVDAMGKVTGVELMPGLTQELAALAQAAVRTWKFSPAKENGSAIASRVTVPVCFAVDHQSPEGFKKPDSMIVPSEWNRAPVYPEGYKHAGIVGSVKVVYVVEIDGNVSSVKVVSASNPGMIDSTVEAVLKWKFKPAMAKGVPVRMRVLQTIDFASHQSSHEAFEVTTKGPPSNLPKELQYDVPAKVLNGVTPVYPREAYIQKLHGKADIKAIVSPDGAIRVSKIDASAPAFQESAQAMIDSLRFRPATMKGVPVNFIFHMEVVFDGDLLTGEDLRIARILRKNAGEIHSAKELDAKPKAKYTVAPVYPVVLEDQGGEGEALVDVIVDEDGGVHFPKVLSATNPAFGASAMQAVSAWKFEPAKVKGKSVVWHVGVPVRFTIKGKNEKAAPANGTPPGGEEVKK